MGTRAGFGDFDACLASTSIDETFNGNYCEIDIFTPPSSHPILYGMANSAFTLNTPIVVTECLPSTCTPEDVYVLIKSGEYKAT